MIIKIPYDAQLFFITKPGCNLSCAYCLDKDMPKQSQSRASLLRLIYRKLWSISYSIVRKSPKHRIVRYINADKLCATLGATNKIFQIHFSGGGEPFLIENIIEVCRKLSRRHYLSFNTNLVSNDFKEFIRTIPKQKVSGIVASLHYNELCKKKLLEKYIHNYKLLSANGFNIRAEAVAYPGLLKKATKIRKLFSKRGINIVFSPYQGVYQNKKYPESYTLEMLNTFKLKYNTALFKNKGRLCNSGFNVGFVNLFGDVFSCLVKDKHDMGNIYSEINFKKHLVTCPYEFCFCPTRNYNKPLFTKAIYQAQNKLKE